MKTKNNIFFLFLYKYVIVVVGDMLVKEKEITLHAFIYEYLSYTQFNIYKATYICMYVYIFI